MAKKIVNNVLELPDGKIADEVLSISDLQTTLEGVDYYTMEVSVLKPEELKLTQVLKGTPQIGWYYMLPGEALKPIETDKDIAIVDAAAAGEVKLYSLDA